MSLNKQESEHQKDPAAAKRASSPLDNKYIWTFWGAVLTVLIAAHLLDYMLPGVPERVIERYIMLVFALFLAVFLSKL